MRRIVVTVFMAAILAACSGLPEISPPDGSYSTLFLKNDPQVFPKGRWRFVHAIEAGLPGGEKAFMMGVTRVDSDQGDIHSILMTIEGLVLFDAEWNGEITVNRAVPPFDSENFANGLMGDVRMMFFSPGRKPVQTGFTKTGAKVRRFQNGEATTDVIIHPDDSWTIRQYLGNRPRRTLHADPERGPGGKFPERLNLTAHIPSGYSLHLRLVDAARETP